MSEHEAFRGVTGDHLYKHCPGLQRAMNGPNRGDVTDRMGRLLFGTVDPLGTDVCGWCRSVYIARRMK